MTSMRDFRWRSLNCFYLGCKLLFPVGTEDEEQANAYKADREKNDKSDEKLHHCWTHWNTVAVALIAGAQSHYCHFEMSVRGTCPFVKRVWSV